MCMPKDACVETHLLSVCMWTILVRDATPAPQDLGATISSHYHIPMMVCERRERGTIWRRASGVHWIRFDQHEHSTVLQSQIQSNGRL